MAAHILSSAKIAGLKITLFEKRPSAGRKILVAGSSGLNVSHDCPLEEFAAHYRGIHEPQIGWNEILAHFPPQRWLDFIHSLGLQTFLGTSRRYFVKGMKGSNLLKAWTDALTRQGVEFRFNLECVDYEATPNEVQLRFSDQTREAFTAVCFCLGGGSWEKDVSWPLIFTSKNVEFTEFRSSNCGFQLEWPAPFLEEAEGLPLKDVVLTTSRGNRQGELVVTRYGLEGTPIYSVGESGQAWLDLKPGLSLEALQKKLESPRDLRENLSPVRRVKKLLNLCPASLALIYHLTPREILGDLKQLTARIKHFPILLGERQPLSEAISSSGGICWSEFDSTLMFKKFPGVFAAGEMLAWDAPTGGFLIQACVSQGAVAAQGILRYLKT